MPLLTSPVDGSPMKQINRFGIELDICPTSGGVWLDKGELEKLMAFIKQAAAEEDRQHQAYDERYARDEPRYEEPRRQSSHGRSYDRDDDDDDDRDHYHRGGHPHGKHKKKGPMHQMMDIFDF